MTVGTRAQVMHGTADKTPGGLTKKDLKYNKWGRIVSKAKSAKAKKAPKADAAPVAETPAAETAAKG